MKLDVIKLDGGKGGSIELPDDIFGIEEIRADILQRCVTWQLAKRRAGTHKIQVRNEVSRTGKKMYKQKGTGNARHGDKKVPHFRKGGHWKTKLRTREDYHKDMPKKMRRKANRNALLAKLLDQEVKVVAGLRFDEPKTRAFRDMLKALGVEQSALVALSGDDEKSKNARLSARNIEQVELCRADQLTAYNLLNNRFLVIDRADLEAWLSGPTSQTGKEAKVAPLGRVAEEVA